MPPSAATPVVQHLIARRDKLYEQLCASGGPNSNRQMLEVYREYQQIEEILRRSEQEPNKNPPQNDKRKQRHDDDDNVADGFHVPVRNEEARKARDEAVECPKPAPKRKKE